MPNFGLSVVVPPAAEPLTLDEAKVACRQDAAVAAEDAYIGGLIRAAREYTEEEAARAWVARTVELSLPGFPGSPGVLARSPWAGRAGTPGPPTTYEEQLLAAAVRLPVAPVLAVTRVTYYDPAGAAQTLDPALWQAWAEHAPGLVAPAPGAYWPATQAGRMKAVAVQFVCGYGDPTQVPARAKVAMMAAVAYWYENRGDGKDPTAGAAEMGLPPASVALLAQLRWRGYR